MEMSKIFSKNLVKFRKIKGYSQMDLAKKTGLTQRMINYYENNPGSIPIEKLKQLVKELDIQISDLFSENSSKNSIHTLDIRWIKKINDIRYLPEEDQKEINRHINYLVKKNKEKKSTKSLKVPGHCKPSVPPGLQ